MRQDPSNDSLASTERPLVARGLRTPRSAAVAGIAFGVLYVLCTIVLTLRPPDEVGAGEFTEWFRTAAATNLSVVSFYLTPLAGLAFLWFVAVIRNQIGEREDRFFATVFIGSGLLFVAMLWAAGASAGSIVSANPVEAARVLDLAMFEVTHSLAHTFFFVYAARAAAVFLIVTSTIAYGTGAFPRWLVLLGYIFAIVQFFSAGLLDITALLFPAWVVVLSASILVGDSRAGRA